MGGGGGSGKKDAAPSTPPSKAAPAPSMPLSKAALGNILDDNNDPFYRCAAHRLCLSMDNQTSQFLMCINCNQCIHLFCTTHRILPQQISPKRGRRIGRKPRWMKRIMSQFVFSVQPRLKLLKYRLRRRSFQSASRPVRAKQHGRRK